MPGLKKIKELFHLNLTTIPDLLNKKHLPALDGLRGISIMLVIASHFCLNTRFSIYVEGLVGVGIFFVISGFLITTLLLKEKILKGKISLKNFYIRRALRILPVAYLFLIVLKLLTFVFDFKVKTLGLFAAGLYILNFPIAYDFSYYHFWTLAVEEQFYLLFPLILVLNLNRYTALTIILIISMTILNFLGFNNIEVFYSSKIIHKITFGLIHLWGMGTCSILIGSLCSILVFKRIIVIEKLNNSYFLSFIILVIAIAIRTAPIVNFAYYTFNLIFPILIAYIILLSLKGDNFLNRILNHPLLVKIGVLSYSLYVWQQIFTHAQPWGYLKYGDSIILNLLMLFIIAYLSYNFFEKRFLLLKEKFK